MPSLGVIMGKWHTPTQIGLTLKKIELDIPLKDIYEWEYNLGWTDCSTVDTFWTNTKERVLKLTGKTVFSFIKSNTISYRNVIFSRRNYLIKMSKKSKELTKEEKKKLYDKFSKDELILIIEAFEERVKEMEEEKKDHERVKSKCLTYIKINELFRNNNRKINKQTICKILSLSKRTLNNKLNNDSLYIDKKVRKDSIVNSCFFAAMVNKIFNDSNYIYGHRRIYKILTKYNINCSLRTVANAMKQYNLYAAERYSKKRVYELKCTNNPGTYLLSNDQLLNYSFGEVYSIDFSQIKTASGIMWMHAARDVISGKVLFCKLVDNQKKEIVLEHFKLLPKTTKVINTDYGSNYLSYDVQAFLNLNKIKHSLGRVGCSYDNRWIEDFWKRIKYEWFTQYPTEHLSNDYVQLLINNYISFFNFERLTLKNDSWLTIPEIEKNFVK